LNTNVEKMRNFIEVFTPKFMKTGKIPGFSIAIVQEGEIIYAEGFGSRNLKKNLPATPDTLYCIGSCTKSFVAMSIMQLVERGKISLEDTVDQYVPLKIRVSGKPITIHHLLTHSSGIPSLGASGEVLYKGLGEKIGIPLGGVNDFYRHLNGAEDEIVDEPGKRFFYFNDGYIILGHIIQEVSGLTFDNYITENILKPLKMKKTTLSKKQYEKDLDRMIPYLKKPDGTMTPTELPFPTISDNPEFSFIVAPGGIISSVKELTNYLTVNIEKGRFEDVQLLSSKSIEKMQKPYIERPFKLFGKSWYGYGWMASEDFFGYKLVWHSGSIFVSSAVLAFIPDLKIGVAMACNTIGFPHVTIAQGIFAALTGKNPAKVIPALQIIEMMKLLTGTYKTYGGRIRVRVMNKGGFLYFELKSPFREFLVPLIPEDGSLESYKFYTLLNGIRQNVEFVVNSPEKSDLYKGTEYLETILKFLNLWNGEKN
jgi:CubicO group peptidase (beta-lactamase class C family)